MTLRFSKEGYIIMERNSISIFVSIWKLLFPLQVSETLIFIFGHCQGSFPLPQWSLPMTWAYGLLLNMRILFLCVPYIPLRHHKMYHWGLGTAYVLIILFSFPFIPEADFHCKPQKSRLYYAFFPSTDIFISSLSSRKYFSVKKIQLFPVHFFQLIAIPWHQLQVTASQLNQSSTVSKITATPFLSNQRGCMWRSKDEADTSLTGQQGICL